MKSLAIPRASPRAHRGLPKMRRSAYIACFDTPEPRSHLLRPSCTTDISELSSDSDDCWSSVQAPEAVARLEQLSRQFRASQAQSHDMVTAARKFIHVLKQNMDWGPSSAAYTVTHISDAAVEQSNVNSSTGAAPDEGTKTNSLVTLVHAMGVLGVYDLDLTPRLEQMAEKRLQQMSLQQHAILISGFASLGHCLAPSFQVSFYRANAEVLTAAHKGPAWQRKDPACGTEAYSMQAFVPRKLHGQQQTVLQHADTADGTETHGTQTFLSGKQHGKQQAVLQHADTANGTETHSTQTFVSVKLHGRQHTAGLLASLASGVAWMDRQETFEGSHGWRDSSSCRAAKEAWVVAFEAASTSLVRSMALHQLVVCMAAHVQLCRSGFSLPHSNSSPHQSGECEGRGPVVALLPGDGEGSQRTVRLQPGEGHGSEQSRPGEMHGSQRIRQGGRDGSQRTTPGKRHRSQRMVPRWLEEGQGSKRQRSNRAGNVQAPSAWKTALSKRLNSSLSTPSVLVSLPPEDLTLILISCAAMDVRLHHTVLNTVAHHLWGGGQQHSELPCLGPNHVADTIWALAALGFSSRKWDLTRAFVEALHMQLHQMSPKSLVRSLAACARLGIKPYRDWLGVFNRRLMLQLYMSLDREDVQLLFWAFATLRVIPDTESIARMFHELERHAPSLTLSELEAVLASVKLMFPKAAPGRQVEHFIKALEQRLRHMESTHACS